MLKRKKIFLAWNKHTHATGFEVIDDQHKELFEIINDLYMVNNSDREKLIPGILEKLLYYCQYHFSTEEVVFTKYGYPLELEHIEYHKEFIDKIFELQTHFEKRTYCIKNDLLIYLKKWIQEHILIEDRKYVQHFMSKTGDPFAQKENPELKKLIVKKGTGKMDITIGIPEIDRQHYELLTILKEISKARYTDKKAHFIEKVLIKLSYYSKYHFSTEEMLMKETGFNGLDKQLSKHQIFKKKVSTYAKKYQEKRLNLSDDITKFIYNWTVEHIMEDDKAFGAFYTRK